MIFCSRMSLSAAGNCNSYGKRIMATMEACRIMQLPHVAKALNFNDAVNNYFKI